MQRSPDVVTYPHYLAGTLNNLADNLQALNRPAEAIKVFEEAVRLEKAALDRAPHSREYRLLLSGLYHNLARAYRLEKRHADAVGLALERRQLWLKNGPELGRLLADFLEAAALLPADAPERRRYVDHALATLDMALAAGYKDFNRLHSDPALTLLRERDEFGRLVKAHAAKPSEN